jgi:hypothetical protein
MLSLSACAQAPSKPVAPDVVNYSRPVMNKAADEIEARTCPVLGDVMMPDYLTMRDQSRYIRGKE